MFFSLSKVSIYVFKVVFLFFTESYLLVKKSFYHNLILSIECKLEFEK